MNDQLELTISEDELVSSYLVFIYGGSASNFFTIAQLHLFNISPDEDNQSTNVSSNVPFIGIFITILAGLLVVIIKKNV
ncbi:MAG: hypothetical protein ACW991_05950 [Candidatus Hodarchaeales archaeon]|jgi:hypothetical protein